MLWATGGNAVEGSRIVVVLDARRRAQHLRGSFSQCLRSRWIGRLRSIRTVGHEHCHPGPPRGWIQPVDEAPRFSRNSQQRLGSWRGRRVPTESHRAEVAKPSTWRWQLNLRGISEDAPTTRRNKTQQAPVRSETGAHRLVRSSTLAAAIGWLGMDRQEAARPSEDLRLLIQGWAVGLLSCDFGH